MGRLKVCVIVNIGLFGSVPPGCAPGPHDADGLFDDFISMVDQRKEARTNA